MKTDIMGQKWGFIVASEDELCLVQSKFAPKTLIFKQILTYFWSTFALGRGTLSL